MTLPEYRLITRNVVEATGRLKDALASNNPQEGIEVLAGRLVKACEELSQARCPNASTSNFVEAARVIRQGMRLVFQLEASRLKRCGGQ
jgi:hypothetical protein